MFWPLTQINLPLFVSSQLPQLIVAFLSPVKNRKHVKLQLKTGCLHSANCVVEAWSIFNMAMFTGAEHSQRLLNMT